MPNVFLLAGYFVPTAVHFTSGGLDRAKQHRSVTEFENNNGRNFVLFASCV